MQNTRERGRERVEKKGERERAERGRRRGRRKRETRKTLCPSSKLEKKKKKVRWRTNSFSLGEKARLEPSFLPSNRSLHFLVTMSQTLDRARKLAGRLAGGLRSMQNASVSSSSSSVAANSTTVNSTLLQQTRAASSGARPGEATPSIKAAAGPHGVINVSGFSSKHREKG